MMEKRPVFFFGAAIFAGVFSAGLKPWRLTYALLVSIPVLCLIYCVVFIRKERRFVLGIVVFSAITSILPAAAYTDCVGVWKNRLISFREYDGKDISATLKLTSSVERTVNAYRVEAAPLNIEGKVPGRKGIRAPDKVLLSFSRDSGDGLPDKLSYGSVVNIRGKLVKPAPQQNDFLFDYQKYLFSKGISAVIYAEYGEPEITASPKRVFGAPVNPIGAGIALSNRIENIFIQTMPPNEASLITAMLTGKTGDLDERLRAEFTATGLLHLMAVSGLHIMIIAGLTAALARKAGLSARSAKTAAFAFIIVFTFIAGFTPSVVRAAFTYGLSIFSKTARKAFDQLVALGFAAIILMAYDPMQAFGAGFQLSFASALSICLISKIIIPAPAAAGIKRSIIDTVRVSLAVCIGCYPVQTALFHGVSTVSILSNLLCAPFVAFAIGAGISTAIAGLISLAAAPIPASITVNFLWIIERIAASVARIPNALTRAGALSPAAFIFYYLFIACVLLLLRNSAGLKANKRGSLRAAAIILTVMTAALPACAFFNPGVRQDQMEIVFLDVGHSNAAYINIGGRYHAVVDAGGSINRKELETSTETRLYEYLSGRGVPALDLAVATHGDLDHIQGFASIFSHMSVKYTLLPRSRDAQLEALAALARSNGSDVVRSGAGDSVNLAPLAVLTVLSPSTQEDDPEVSFNTAASNDSGLVIQIIFGEMRALFCGDIGNAAETELLYNVGEAGLNSQLMSVPHHGSKYSSGAGFLSGVSPETAVAGIGKNNYGHPAPETLKRYADAGADFYRTDWDGMVSVLCDREGIVNVKRFNDDENGYAWQRRAS